MKRHAENVHAHHHPDTVMLPGRPCKRLTPSSSGRRAHVRTSAIPPAASGGTDLGNDRKRLLIPPQNHKPRPCRALPERSKASEIADFRFAGEQDGADRPQPSAAVRQQCGLRQMQENRTSTLSPRWGLLTEGGTRYQHQGRTCLNVPRSSRRQARPRPRGWWQDPSPPFPAIQPQHHIGEGGKICRCCRQAGQCRDARLQSSRPSGHPHPHHRAHLA